MNKGAGLPEQGGGPRPTAEPGQVNEGAGPGEQLEGEQGGGAR